MTFVPPETTLVVQGYPHPYIPGDDTVDLHIIAKNVLTYYETPTGCTNVVMIGGTNLYVMVTPIKFHDLLYSCLR